MFAGLSFFNQFSNDKIERAIKKASHCDISYSEVKRARSTCYLFDKNA